MKWLKRLVMLVALGLLGAMAFSLIGVYLYHGTPRWYRKPVASRQQVMDAANRADQKLLDLFSWVASARAQQLRALHGRGGGTDAVVEPKTISFDDDEINSFATSWKSPGNSSGMDIRMSRYFTNGRLVLEDNSLILVGDSPAYGTLASVEFDPSIDGEGNFHLDLDSIKAGLLPIPQSAISSQLDRLQGALIQQLNAERPSVQIDPAQTANTAALASSWIRLLLCSLRDEPADPVLIIPFDMSNLRRGFPVKLTNVKVEEGRLTMTLDVLSAGEDEKLEQRLKQMPAAEQ